MATQITMRILATQQLPSLHLTCFDDNRISDNCHCILVDKIILTKIFLLFFLLLSIHFSQQTLFKCSIK